ncbi:MAG: bleomycin resistance protein [Acinetobacter sp.]
MKFEGQITANLPAIDLACTASFYQSLGFDLVYQSAEWMIIRLGEMTLEFFHHPHLDPNSSWHSACIRVAEIQPYYEYWSKVNWSLWETARMTDIQDFDEIRQFCIIDPNGSLLRCIEVTIE